MTQEQLVFILVKGFFASVIGFICICRAVKMDRRVRRLSQLTFLGLGMFGFGLAWTPLMPAWMLHVCVVGFMAAVCALLIDGEKQWRNGTPEYLLRFEEQWPQRERRGGDRRINRLVLFVCALVRGGVGRSGRGHIGT